MTPAQLIRCVRPAGAEPAFRRCLTESWTFGSAEIPTRAQTAASPAMQCPPAVHGCDGPCGVARWGAVTLGAALPGKAWFFREDTRAGRRHWPPREGKEPSCWRNPSTSP